MKLSEFLNLPLSHRQSHIDLESPCLLHPTPGKVLKASVLRDQHFSIHKIENDLPNLRKSHLCHLCKNPHCRSYFHTYLGTPLENSQDKVTDGTSGKDDEWFTNGFFEIKWNPSHPPLPKDFEPGRLKVIGRKVSSTRRECGIKNATNGVNNVQVRTALGETLPEGFQWGYTLKRNSSTCPHCKVTGNGPNMKRYHFDNCKLRPLQ
jgi:hypothetical protein